MSLDWYLLPADRCTTAKDAEAAFMECEELEADDAETPEAAALAAALVAPFEGIDDSPYASFPLDIAGSVVIVNVRSDRADDAFKIVAPLAIAHGYGLYDTYDGGVSTGEDLAQQLADEA